MIFTTNYSPPNLNEAMDITLEGRDSYGTDAEKTVADEAHLQNTTVRNYLWRDITVTVKDRETKQPLHLLENVNGVVEAGVFSPCSANGEH